MSNQIKLSRRAFLAAPAAAPLVLSACGPDRTVFNLAGATMGTSYSVTVVDEDGALDEKRLSTAIEDALSSVNQQMSNWDARSEISRVNAAPANQPLTLSANLGTVMNAAEFVHRASDGRFDATMGGLIELWGFGADGAHRQPTDDAIAAALAEAGQSRVLSYDQGALRKRHDDTRIYLAGIGKGYGADQIGRALAALGARDFMIEIGGDIYAAGRNPQGAPWRVGIETPAPLGGGVFESVGVSNLGLASSGDYRNYFDRDGQRYSHAIDPTTGRPIDHDTASATVLADNAMLADAWSTAMLVLGSQRGLEIAEAQGVAVLFIDRGDGAYSASSSSRFDALTA